MQRMKKPQFIKQVIKQKPEFSSSGLCFYVSPVEYVLSGFVCDIKSSVAEIQRFIYPLFDLSDTLSISYCSSILEAPNDMINFDNAYMDNKIEKKDLANEFIKRINPFIDSTYDFLSLESFIEYIDAKDRINSWPYNQRVLAYAHIIEGNKDKAIECLDKAIEYKGRGKLFEDVRKECEEMLQIVSGSIDDAKTILINNASKMKEKFKILQL